MNTPKTHPLNVSYLVVGLVFLGIAGSWALRAGGAVDTHESRWMLPAVLVAAGVIGLVAFAAKGISRSRQDQAQDGTPGWVTTEPGADPYLDHGTQDETTQQDTTRYDTDVEGDPR